MRYTLTEKEINTTVDLLINKYELSTRFLNNMFGKDLKDNSQGILRKLEDSEVERRLIIKQFTEGTIEFLCNYWVLTTGFHAPKTRNIVMHRSINSNILYEQIVGRE